VRATLDQWDSITPKEQTIQSMNAQMNWTNPFQMKKYNGQ
jgi:hypothetical protein